MSLEILGLDAFMGALDHVTKEADAATHQAVAKAAAAVEKAAKENASGRPGPEVVTGHLRRGIRTNPVHREGPIGWQTEVGPTVIYSRRVELGFHGADALNRIYHQHGHPYFTPAWKKVAPQLPEIFRAEWSRAMFGG